MPYGVSTKECAEELARELARREPQEEMMTMNYAFEHNGTAYGPDGVIPGLESVSGVFYRA